MPAGSGCPPAEHDGQRPQLLISKLQQCRHLLQPSIHRAQKWVHVARLHGLPSHLHSGKLQRHKGQLAGSSYTNHCSEALVLS